MNEQQKPNPDDSALRSPANLTIAAQAVAAAELRLQARAQAVIDGSASDADALEFLTVMRLNRIISGLDLVSTYLAQQMQDATRGLVGPILPR